jgi:hypothetical protein
MTPSDELRTQLRRLIDEGIPPGKTEADTRFTDAELDEILTASSFIEEAAAEGWTRKASRAFSERGGLEESQAGDERFKFFSLEKYRDHCLQMAGHFWSKVPSGGSRLFAFQPPDVLGTEGIK